MPLNPQVQDVTQKIIARSAASRAAYLQRVERAAQAGPARAHLSCGNQAHAYAAMGEAQADLASARARLAVLRAEWAYLNRPDRLRELAELNFDPLALLPISPDQFGRTDQVDYPQPEPMPELTINNPVDVSTLSMPDAAATETRP